MLLLCFWMFSMFLEVDCCFQFSWELYHSLNWLKFNRIIEVYNSHENCIRHWFHWTSFNSFSFTLGLSPWTWKLQRTDSGGNLRWSLLFSWELYPIWNSNFDCLHWNAFHDPSICLNSFPSVDVHPSTNPWLESSIEPNSRIKTLAPGGIEHVTKPIEILRFAYWAKVAARILHYSIWLYGPW